MTICFTIDVKVLKGCGLRELIFPLAYSIVYLSPRFRNQKTFIHVALVIFGFLAAAASALAINSNTFLSLSTSASPNINSTITPQGHLLNQQTIISTTTPIASGVVELWDVTVTPNKSITTATTNSNGDYQVVLKIICNKNFKMEARFAGTSDYLPETSNQATVTPTGGPACNAGQDPWLVTSTAPPTGSTSGSSGNYIPLVQIPNVNTADFLQYLRDIYNFLISIVGILAMAALVYGGFRYLTSVGNPAAVEDAKDIINSAIIGLVLALSSWLILNEINPDILVLKKPGQIGALPGKYAYNQLNRACVADPNLEGVPIPNSQDKTCKCVDGTSVTFTPPSTAPAGPYVVSTSIAPCSVKVSQTPAEIIVTFADPVAAIDGTSVTNPAPAGAMSFPGPGPAISSVTMTSANVAKVTFAGNFLANQDYELIVGASVRDTAGNTLGSAYHVRFTTAGSFSGTSCVQPVPTIVNCQVACSNPSTPGLTPSGYHCMKADLRVGKTKSDRTYSSITAKKDETLYFDADTYVIHDKPIVAYEMDYKNDFYSAFSSDKACDVVSNSCPIGLRWNNMSPCDGISGNEYKYTAVGVYQAWMRVYDAGCNPSTSEISITIENY